MAEFNIAVVAGDGIGSARSSSQIVSKAEQLIR